MYCNWTCQQRSDRHADVGQAIGLVVIAIVLIASIAIAMASVGSRLVERSAAQNAADAAALAGAFGGRADAEVIANRNGGNLVSFRLERLGPDVVIDVTVRIGGETASARASTAP